MTMDWTSILLSIALLAGVAFVIAWPVLRRLPPTGPALHTDSLDREHETILGALRDLDFDQATGKVDAEEYTLQRASLMAQGAEVLKQLEARKVTVRPNDHRNGQPSPGEALPNASVGDELEAVIAAKRRTLAEAHTDALETLVAARPVFVVSPSMIESRADSAAGQPAPACPHCQAQAGLQDRFCFQCGRSLHLTCPQCGHAARVEDKFCGHCGATLPQTEGAQ
jgi:hypothetical protein